MVNYKEQTAYKSHFTDRPENLQSNGTQFSTSLILVP